MSISFNRLGSYGRLGNQMFQYASLRGIASRHEYSFTIPDSKGNNEWADHQLFKYFKLSSLDRHNIGLSQHRTISEGSFNFDHNLFHKCEDNVDIVGYLQSEKYFLHIEDIIRQDFTFHDHISKQAQETLEEYSKEPLISLHVRRTDYVNNSFYNGGCSIEHYDRALSLLDHNTKVIIFTDDIQWVADQNFFKKDRYIIHNPVSNATDMCMMTMCDYNIIANSSFSWWGAWLGSHKRVIAPKTWFESGHRGWSDIYCNGWEIV